MLASFSGKTPDWSVQMPPASLAAIERGEQLPAEAEPSDALGDVDAVLRDAAVAGAIGDGRQRGPADDVAVERDDEAMVGEMAGVPRLPRAGRVVSKVALPVRMPSS